MEDGSSGDRNILLTQLSGIRKREMNHPLRLCELAARAPDISAGHMVKQAWLLSNAIQQNYAVREFVDGGVNISNELTGETDG